MNWCKPHWQQLREVLKSKGLDKFGAQTSEEAMAEIQHQIEEGTEKGFDPLLGSWARINTKMAEGLNRMGRHKELLELKCPLCTLVEDQRPELVADWLEGVTEGARLYAVEEGLLKPQ